MEQINLKLETAVEAETLEAFLRDEWPGILKTQEYRDLLRERGLDHDALDPAAPPSLRSIGQGFDPAFTAILLTLATPLAAKAAKGLERVVSDLWEQVVLPRIVRKFGVGRVKRSGK